MLALSGTSGRSRSRDGGLSLLNIPANEHVEPGSGKGQNYMEVTTLTKLAAGDTVELSGRQTSGGSMSIYSNAEYGDNETPRLEISWVGPPS